MNDNEINEIMGQIERDLQECLKEYIGKPRSEEIALQESLNYILIKFTLGGEEEDGR